MKAGLGMHCWDRREQDGCQDHQMGMELEHAQLPLDAL